MSGFLANYTTYCATATYHNYTISNTVDSLHRYLATSLQLTYNRVLVLCTTLCVWTSYILKHKFNLTLDDMLYYSSFNLHLMGIRFSFITWVGMFTNNKEYGRLVVGSKCSVVWRLNYCYARADGDKDGGEGYSNGTWIVLAYGARYSLKYMCVFYCD